MKSIASGRCNGSSGNAREGEGSLYKRMSCSPVEKVESVKCWVSSGDRQLLEPGLGRKDRRLEVDYGQLARMRRTLVYY